MTHKNAPLLTCVLLLIICLGLFGCTASSGATPSPSPTLPAPTSTPVITATVTPYTPIEIDLTALKNYTPPNNLFSISYPPNWQYFEQPESTVFLEPNGQTGYSVAFVNADTTYDAQELTQYLMTYIAQNFAGEERNFKAISQEQLPDGAVMAQFSSLDPNLGQTINEVRVTQAGSIIFILHLNSTQEQWPAVRRQLQALADTFTSTAPPPLSQDTEEPVWTLIGPQNKEFGFLYASDWEILEQSDSTVSVALPLDNMIFSASSFAWPDVTDPEAAKNAALDHLEDIENSYTDVQNLPPAQFPLDTVTGATIDYVYVTEDGTTIAGSVITALNKGKMYKIVFTAPTDIYEAALQWFNTMYKSFKFLYPEQGLDDTDEAN